MPMHPAKPMGIFLKPEHLQRYKDIAWFLLKYGRGDLLARAGLEDAIDAETPRDGEPPVEVTPEAAALAEDLE